MRFRISSLTGLFASFATGGVVAKVDPYATVKRELLEYTNGINGLDGCIDYLKVQGEGDTRQVVCAIDEGYYDRFVIVVDKNGSANWAFSDAPVESGERLEWQNSFAEDSLQFNVLRILAEHGDTFFPEFTPPAFLAENAL